MLQRYLNDYFNRELKRRKKYPEIFQFIEKPGIIELLPDEPFEFSTLLKSNKDFFDTVVKKVTGILKNYIPNIVNIYLDLSSDNIIKIKYLTQDDLNNLKLIELDYNIYAIIFSYLDSDDVKLFCELSDVCESQNFWITLIQNKFPDKLKPVKFKYDWKDIYYGLEDRVKDKNYLNRLLFKDNQLIRYLLEIDQIKLSKLITADYQLIDYLEQIIKKDDIDLLRLVLDNLFKYKSGKLSIKEINYGLVLSIIGESEMSLNMFDFMTFYFAHVRSQFAYELMNYLINFPGIIESVRIHYKYLKLKSTELLDEQAIENIKQILSRFYSDINNISIEKINDTELKFNFSSILLTRFVLFDNANINLLKSGELNFQRKQENHRVIIELMTDSDIIFYGQLFDRINSRQIDNVKNLYYILRSNDKFNVIFIEWR